MSSGTHILLLNLPAVIIPRCLGLTPDFSSQVLKLLMLFRRTGPRRIIGRSLSHLRDCKAIGKSAQVLPLLCDDGVHLNSFVREWSFLANRPDLFVKGRAKNTLFGTKALKSRCLALRIDFAKYIRVSKVDFCTSPMGWCSVCCTQRPL